MSARRKDLYQVLGVARDVDADALRKAYRKLARELHPDVNPGDAQAEERFKEVSEAYAVLSDPEKRKNYDEFGDVSLESGFDAEAARRAREQFGARFGQGGGPFDFGDAGAAGGEFAFGDLDELFQRFGRERAAPRQRRGHDLEATIELDFMDAVRGTEQRLTLSRPTADGGVAPERVTVRIPAGVADGGRIRLPGKGAPGRGGAPSGDLWATVRIRPHPIFQREGRDVYLEVPVTVAEAVKGAKIEIPTLDGRATVTLPPGTDSGRRLRLSGKGVPDPRGGASGDLYVTIAIRVPKDLDEAGAAALDALDACGPEDPRAELFR